MRGQWAKSVVRAPHNEVFVLLVRAAAGAAAVTVQHMSRKTAVICRGGATRAQGALFLFLFLILIQWLCSWVLRCSAGGGGGSRTCTKFRVGVCQCVCVRDFVRCWISHRLREPGGKALTLTWIHVRRTYEENISGGHMRRTYEMETKMEICAVAVITLHDTDVTCSENGSTALV